MLATVEAPNPYRTNAREKKASAIALLIWSKLGDEERTNPDLPWSVSQMGQKERDRLAAAALQRSPSDRAWSLVVALLCELVQAARGSKAEPCVECGGQGVVHWRTCQHSGNCPCSPAESTCSRCKGSKKEPCESCGEPSQPGWVVTPLGLYCPGCAEQLRAAEAA